MECLWDLMRSIPSLEVENASVLDEFYWLQKDDPHRSLRRMTQNRGEAVPTDGKYMLSRQTQNEINLLCITRDEDLYDKKLTDVFGKGLFRQQLLGVLADDVRFLCVAQRPRNEAVPSTLPPPHRRTAEFDRCHVHQVQPVRVLRPPGGRLAEAAWRRLPVRHPGDRRAVQHQPRSQSGPTHRLDQRRTARRARPDGE